MYNFICKSFPHLKHSFTISPPYRFHIYQLNLLSTKSKEATKPISKNVNPHSFTVNYLMKTCGFSPDKAISVSNYVHFDKPDKPDAVISFFMNKGFTNTQVMKMIQISPKVILSNPKKTLLPKIDFFESKGFTKTHVSVMLVLRPSILSRSLKKCIIPNFNSLSCLLGSDKKAIITICRSPQMLLEFQSRVIPKVKILQNACVPDVKISYLLKDRPNVFTKSTVKLKEAIYQIKKMGFDPVKSVFVIALAVMSSLSKLSWKEKIEVYRRWGCTEAEVLVAFKHYPWCIMTSMVKIDKIMNIFVNEMGWDSSKVLKNSYLFTYSVEKRIVPRCSVYNVLISKGLIKKEMGTIISLPEDLFLDRFVYGYEKEAPELLKIYHEKLAISSSCLLPS